MTDAPKEMSGHCLCGSISYHVAAEPIVQAVCHCTECQRQTGTAYSVVVGVPRAALTIEGSTLSSFTTTGEVHGMPTERKFCSACGSPIVSLVEAAPDLAFIKAGTLDDASWLEPSVEVWTRSAQPWTPHFDDTHKIAVGTG